MCFLSVYLVLFYLYFISFILKTSSDETHFFDLVNMSMWWKRIITKISRWLRVYCTFHTQTLSL